MVEGVHKCTEQPPIAHCPINDLPNEAVIEAVIYVLLQNTVVYVRIERYLCWIEAFVDVFARRHKLFRAQGLSAESI